MDKLPVDLFIQEITYLPFADVESLCQTNKMYHDFCTSDRYSNRWRSLITNTFSQTENYQENLDKLLAKYGGYNYSVYTNFVKLLDPVTQGMIYLEQKDMKSFDKLTDRQRLLAYFLMNDLKKIKELFPRAQDFIDLLEGKTMTYSALNRILMSMIDEGSLAGVKFSMKAGALVTDDILNRAIKADRYDIVKYIINKENVNKLAALGIARIYGKDRIAKLLME